MRLGTAAKEECFMSRLQMFVTKHGKGLALNQRLCMKRVIVRRDCMEGDRTPAPAKSYWLFSIAVLYPQTWRQGKHKKNCQGDERDGHDTTPQSRKRLEHISHGVGTVPGMVATNM